MKRRDVYGRIATVTGWDLEQIGRMTMRQLRELFEYWNDHPPTHELVGAYLGVGPSKAPKAASFADMKAFMEQAGRARG